MTESIIENFLKLNPVLFIGVEFPRKLHKGESNPNVLFEKASSLPKPDGYIRIQNKELNQDFNNAGNLIKNTITHEIGDSDKHKCICFNANHKSYFGNDPQTLDIIKDPIIGIDTLINQINDTDNTINNVMGLKFALGTSGTGKTFRLFGSAISPGIITKVYEKANQDSRKVSYLLFYGRKTKGGEDKTFNEYLFNFKNVGGMVAENGKGKCKISCYKQEKFSGNFKPNNFENFYDKLMSQKIKKIAEVTVDISNNNVKVDGGSIGIIPATSGTSGNPGTPDDHSILQFLRGRNR